MRTVHIVLITAVVASASTLALNHFIRPSTATQSNGMQSSADDATIAPAATGISPGETLASAGASRSNLTTAKPLAEGQLDADELQAKTDELMRKYERQFQTEKVAPAWANSTELAVVDALRSDEAKATGAAVPTEFDVQCRSSLCRIDATYADDGSATDAMTVLAMDVSNKLPRMHRRTIYKPDGTVQLQVYAAR